MKTKERVQRADRVSGRKPAFVFSGTDDGPNPYADPLGSIEVPFVEPDEPAAALKKRKGKVNFKGDLVNKRPDKVRSTCDLLLWETIHP